jgi:hypothetical protein
MYVFGPNLLRLELADLIQSPREEFAIPVDVLWNIIGGRELVTLQKGTIQDRGWEILGGEKEKVPASSCTNNPNSCCTLNTASKGGE